jgi:hypothetical protein
MAKINFKPSIKKFRAWDAKNKTFPFTGFDILGETTVFDLCKQYRLKHALNLEITQFSGFSDDYAADIYEGDILSSFAKTETLNLLVKIENGCFVLYHRLGKWGTLERYMELTEPLGIKVKVIGNVFENPNLI